MAKTKTLLVEWVEESSHRARIQVPADCDVEDLDLENRLADLANGGFEGLERRIEFVEVVDNDAAAQPLVCGNGL